MENKPEYREIPGSYTQKAEKIYNDGVFHFENGNLDEASLLFEKVVKIVPWNPYSYFYLGFIRGVKGDYPKAREYLYKAINLKGDEPDFYNRLGFVCDAEGDIDSSIENFKTAVKLSGKTQYFHNLGFAFHKKGMLKEAIENYNEAVKLDEHNCVYLNNLGSALYEANEYEQSAKYFARTILLNPDNPEYYNNMGLALSHIKPEKIVETMSNNQDVVNNPDSYNIFRQELKKILDLAVFNYLKAIELNSENPEYYNNLGLVFHRSGDFESAIGSYLNAINLNPGNGKYYNNLALTLKETGNYEQSVKYFKKVIELAPWKKTVHFNLSLVYLTLGNFEKGWENIELEKIKISRKQKFLDLYNKPEWNGEDIKGKTIYACWEQGLGDTLHYVRYLHLLKERGAKVILNCQTELINILKQYKYFDLIVSDEVDGEKNEFDAFVFLMSLIRIFTPDFESITANIPYIFSLPEFTEKWSEKFKNETSLKIGFVWQAKFSNLTLSKRSCPVEKFVELIGSFPEIIFYSMQKGPFSSEINKFSLPNLVSLSGEINDFADSAAIMEHIDLLISVDTSIVHLAGAMGKKVWNLLPFSPDWRWFLDRDYSPWYPSMKLIRQKSPGDWDSVFEKVTELLKSGIH